MTAAGDAAPALPTPRWWWLLSVIRKAGNAKFIQKLAEIRCDSFFQIFFSKSVCREVGSAGLSEGQGHETH